MKTLKKLLTFLAILFIAAQFVRPDRTNPPVDPSLDVRAAAQVPLEVAATLQRSCFDCHSNQTAWPWYTNITPVNWWIAKSHVEHARSHYNFSEWGKLEAKDRDHILDEICDEVSDGGMPLPSYLIAHDNARLSDADKRAICDWTKAERARIKAASPAESEKPSEPDEDHDKH